MNPGTVVKHNKAVVATIVEYTLDWYTAFSEVSFSY